MKIKFDESLLNDELWVFSGNDANCWKVWKELDGLDVYFRGNNIFCENTEEAKRRIHKLFVV